MTRGFDSEALINVDPFVAGQRADGAVGNGVSSASARVIAFTISGAELDGHVVDNAPWSRTKAALVAEM